MSSDPKVPGQAAEPGTAPTFDPTLMDKARAALSSWWHVEAPTLEQRPSTELAEIRTDLATRRTLMAADRTLMAWVRTALSLLSFGFTIYKLLQGLQESGAALPAGDSPRNVGLFLTGAGTLAMVMGTIEYWHTLRELRRIDHFSFARAPLLMALFLSVTGVVLFFSIIMRVL
jgi:putative membrane protein